MDQQPDRSKFNIKLDSEGNFTVGASKTINYLFGSLFLIMFIVVMGLSDLGKFSIGELSILLLSLLFFGIGLKNKKNITINTTGIYHNKTFITDWTNFRYAYIRQLANTVSATSQGLEDHYRIVVEYYDSNRYTDFLYSIRLSDSQDKSEYEIIDAIIYFSGVQLTYDIYD